MFAKLVAVDSDRSDAQKVEYPATCKYLLSPWGASKRAKTVLPAGMVLWARDADPEFEEAAGEKWLARAFQEVEQAAAVLLAL